jgi:PAS domain S-box-containing protein
VPQSATSLQDLQKRIAAIEATLTASRRQLVEAQQLSRTGSWEWDVATGTVWWSDELFRIYGLEPGSITPSYEDFLERVHPEDRESVDARNRRAFEDRESFEDVKRVVRADGSEILMRTQGDVVCDEAGRPVRMIGVCEDVTAERRAAERADARALAVRLLAIGERLDEAHALIDDQRAAALVAEARRSIELMADQALAAPGAAREGERRFERGEAGAPS